MMREITDVVVITSATDKISLRWRVDTMTMTCPPCGKIEAYLIDRLLGISADGPEQPALALGLTDLEE